MMGMHGGDPGRQYVRELERRQLREAHERQERTGQPSYFFRKTHLGIGQKLWILGIGFVALIVIIVVAASLT